MAAIPPQTLLTEANCFRCYGASLGELMILDLWDRISQIAPVDSFLNRSGITDATQIAALNTLVLAAKTNGWWNKCDLIYPFVGGTALAHAQNLKSSSFTITWAGAVTHDVNGITGDAATGYGDTGYIPSISGQTILNSSHLGIYRRTAAAFGKFSAGINQAASAFSIGQVVGTAVPIRMNDITNSNVTPASLAWFLTSRTDASNKHGFTGGLDFPFAIASTSLPTISLFILGVNNNGVAAGLAGNNLSGLTCGAGLTFAQYLLMAADWQTFQTTLVRQV